MKVMSPALWLKLHLALIADSVQAAVDTWRKASEVLKYWITADIGMLVLLLLLFALFRGGQN